MVVAERGTQLTDREREVLVLVSDGFSNKDIAGKVFLSEETIKGYLRNILAKLGASTRAHAVAIALREEVIS